MTSILSKKKTSARQQTRARALDLLHRREHPKTIANLLNVGAATVYLIQKRYLTEGFQWALYDKPRSGKPPVIKAEAKARLTALACTDAPAGHARRTLRLLANKAVEFGFVEQVSHTEVGRILKKTL